MSHPAASRIEALHRAARRLNASALSHAARALPPLIFMTDPARTPDPVAAAGRLPRGSGVIFRAFGAPNAVRTGLELRIVARDRGLVLLAGADPALAAAIGADGVHLPQRSTRQAGRIRRAHPDWLITCAAHDAPALRLARLSGADAALLSAVFPSASPSAGRPIGPVRFAALTRAAGLPVYALGGVNERTAPLLLGSGAAGLAVVGAVAER